MAEFENVAIDVRVEDIERVAKRPLIMYIGKPTSSTKGLDGQLYFDEAEKKLYLCTGKVSESSYTWVSINDLSKYVLNSLTIAGIDLKDNITADELKKALGIDLSEYVETSTKIAGLTLSSDILAEDLAKALSVSSVVVETEAPTSNDGEENTFWIDTTTNTLYYCDKRTLSGYNWIEIASGSVTDEQIQNAVDNYLDENPIKLEETDPTVPAWAKAENPPNATIRKLDSYPTSSTVGKVGEIALTTVEKTSGDIRYFAEVLVMCYLNPSDGLYFWKELSYVNSLLSIAGLRLNKDITVNDLITALNALTKTDIADEIEVDEEVNLTNGDKIASVKCVHDTINFLAEKFGEEMVQKADKSYVDEVFATYDNNILAILGGDENVE